MQIKPTFDTTYLICYQRGKDAQVTEVVNTTEAQIAGTILSCISDKIRHPEAKTGLIPSTCIKLMELDNIHKKSRLCRRFPRVYNLSPRQVRIRIEKNIKVDVDEK